MRDRRASDPNGARALSQVAKDAGDRARNLEAEARLAREHELRVAEAQVRLAHGQARAFDLLAKSFFAALGVPWTDEISGLLVEMVQSLAAEPIEDGRLAVRVSPAARIAARRAFERATTPLRSPRAEQELSADFLERVADVMHLETTDEAEGFWRRMQDEIENESPAPPADLDAEPEGQLAVHREPELTDADDDLPAWDEIPPEWQAKYRLNPPLGRHEYAMALRRERSDAERAAARIPTAPRRPDFTHPALGPIDGRPPSL
jgi:hypothetical protein